MRIFLLLMFLWSCVNKTSAQHANEFSDKIFNFQFTYGYQFPGGNFSNLYGNHNLLGFGGILKSRSNYTISIEGNFLFGSEIKQTNIFDKIVTSGGFIAASNGFPADYSVNMRGWAGNINIGRIFKLGKFNHNHGFFINGGIGFLNHYIGIITQRNDVGPLSEYYKKGYDRNSIGIAFNQFAGYYFNSKNRFINFYGGIQFTQAYTKNVRGFNFDEMAFDNDVKNDFAFALKLGWLIPIYMYAKDQDEFQFK